MLPRLLLALLPFAFLAPCIGASASVAPPVHPRLFFDASAVPAVRERAATDGSALLATTEGFALAVDFSGASGADALIVTRGGGAPRPFAANTAPRARLVELGDYRVLSLSAAGNHPVATLDGDTVVVGAQRLRLSPDTEPSASVFEAVNPPISP